MHCSGTHIILVVPVAVHTNQNLSSWNVEVKGMMQPVDFASQFAVAGNMLKCFTAAKFPPTIFFRIRMYAFHSSKSLVNRTIEVNGFSVPVDVICGLTIRAYRTASIRGTQEVESSISMTWTVWALDSLNSLWFATITLHWCIKIIILIQRGLLFSRLDTWMR